MNSKRISKGDIIWERQYNCRTFIASQSWVVEKIIDSEVVLRCRGDFVGSISQAMFSKSDKGSRMTISMDDVAIDPIDGKMVIL